MNSAIFLLYIKLDMYAWLHCMVLSKCGKTAIFWLTFGILLLEAPNVCIHRRPLIG